MVRNDSSFGGVFRIMDSSSRTDDERELHDERHGESLVEIDAPTLANVIRAQNALPLSESDREECAKALETSEGDEQFLANALSALRFLLAELDFSTPPPAGRADSQAG